MGAEVAVADGIDDLDEPAARSRHTVKVAMA